MGWSCSRNCYIRSWSTTASSPGCRCMASVSLFRWSARGDVQPKPELTVPGFYRRAMWCPFVLAAAGWPVGYAFSLFGLEPLTGFSYGVALISGVLAVPYGIYLLMMRTLWPPATEREYRRAMAVAPIGISVIAAILLLAGTAVFGGIRSSTGIRDVLFSFGY